MRQAWATVRELIAATHAERKAELDAGRVDTVFQVGDRVLSRTDLSKLRPRWDGRFTPPARPSPRSFAPALPRRMRCSATANVSRPKPFFERSWPRQPRGTAAGAGGPGLLSGRGRGGEHEAELLAAGGCAALCAVWSSGGSARPPTTSGCGRRKWLAAKKRWRTTTAVAERVTKTLPTCEKPRARQRRAIVSPTEPTSVVQHHRAQ